MSDEYDPERDRPTIPPAPGVPEITIGDTDFDGLSVEQQVTLETHQMLKRGATELFDEDGLLAKIGRHVAHIMQRVDAIPAETDTKLEMLKNALEHRFDTQIGELKEQLTAVQLKLGLHEERESGRLSVAPESAKDSPFVVLVVDDYTDVLQSIERVFEDRPGFMMVSASNGHDALKLLHAYKFDAVLSDLRMPGNGSTLLAHVKAECPNVAFVSMSAYEDRNTARQTLEAGAFGFLPKPFRSNDDLILTLTRACEYSRARARK